MAILYRHYAHHAAIQLSDELTLDSAVELESVLDTLVDVYCYQVLDLIVSSSGGSTMAMAHMLAALRVRREQGLWLRTRVISHAQSAAAVLVCAGDERVADPGARLLFHGVHAAPAHPITASETSVLLGSLQQTDEDVLGLLAARALATPSPGDQIGAERSDRSVLEDLSRACGRTRRRPRSVEALARLVAETVDRAVRGRDRVALTRLYRRLLGADEPISARLALTLRLVDRVGPPPAVVSAPAAHPGPTIPEWSRLYPPSGYVPREALTRHMLVLGETGSGKTVSAVLPLVCAIAMASPHDVGAALVIDPKGELGPVLEALAPERLSRLDADTLVLNLMAGPRWSLDADLAAGRWLTAAHRILCRVASLVPSNPARVLGPHVITNANAEFFDREGTALASVTLAFVLMTTAAAAPAPATWLAGCPAGLRCMEALLERARGDAALRGPNALALTAWLLDSPLAAPPTSGTFQLRVDGAVAPPSLWLFAHVADAARPVFASTPGQARDGLGSLTGYWAAAVVAELQYAGVRASASAVCSDLAAPPVARTLYLGCEPGFRAAASSAPDFARAVSPQGAGPLLLFQPPRGPLDLAAVALKALLFEAVLDDPDRARGDPGLPVVAYVADEFHRFVTSDLVHGEQSFLDTCRSFGAACLLASQSVASLEHALAAGGATAEQNRTAVSIVWNNTATKLVFRTTDPSTIERVAGLCPHRPGLTPVVHVRPLSTLAPGECYAALCDGRFVRCQLHPSLALDILRQASAVSDPAPAEPPRASSRDCDGPSEEAEPSLSHPAPDPHPGIEP